MSDLKYRLTEGLHHCGMCGHQSVEINSRGQWICTACLHEVRPDYMSALRMEAAARIEELEAENARLNALCDQMKIGWGEDAVRAEAAEADLATARNDALEEAARVGADAATIWANDNSEKAARNGIWKTVYSAIRALKSTNQTRKEKE